MHSREKILSSVDSRAVHALGSCTNKRVEADSVHNGRIIK